MFQTAKNSTSGSSGYYVGGSSTLPRGGQLMRAYSPAASSVVGGPNATPTQPKPLATPGTRKSATRPETRSRKVQVARKDGSSRFGNRVSRGNLVAFTCPCTCHPLPMLAAAPPCVCRRPTTRPQKRQTFRRKSSSASVVRPC